MVLTGDNRWVTRKVCHDVGLPSTACCWEMRWKT